MRTRRLGTGAAGARAGACARRAGAHAADPGDATSPRSCSRRRNSTAQRLDISTLKPGDIIEGRYKYIEKIGTGAFGTVLLMEDTVVDERLILKFLNPNVAEDEEIMKRFVHELRYSRKITHRTSSASTTSCTSRATTPSRWSTSPRTRWARRSSTRSRWPLKRALQFGIDIATGMTVAHQVGIVHRDLKPANVLINDEGLLKIVDFGVAAAQREGDTQLTKTGYVIGSPKYMAPEQILGRKVDERADVYALGVILYEMLTGVPPYCARRSHGGDVPARAGQGARRRRRSTRRCRRSWPTWSCKAMAVDKTKRFQTMDELRSALERSVSGAAPIRAQVKFRALIKFSRKR